MAKLQYHIRQYRAKKYMYPLLHLSLYLTCWHWCKLYINIFHFLYFHKIKKFLLGKIPFICIWIIIYHKFCIIKSNSRKKKKKIQPSANIYHIWTHHQRHIPSHAHTTTHTLNQYATTTTHTIYIWIKITTVTKTNAISTVNTWILSYSMYYIYLVFGFVIISQNQKYLWRHLYFTMQCFSQNEYFFLPTAHCKMENYLPAWHLLQ